MCLLYALLSSSPISLLDGVSKHFSAHFRPPQPLVTRQCQQHRLLEDDSGNFVDHDDGRDVKGILGASLEVLELRDALWPVSEDVSTPERVCGPEDWRNGAVRTEVEAVRLGKYLSQMFRPPAKAMVHSPVSLSLHKHLRLVRRQHVCQRDEVPPCLLDVAFHQESPFLLGSSGRADKPS